MKCPVQRHEVVQPRDQSIRLIPLTQGKNAIVDAADYTWLRQFNWCASNNKRGKTWYAMRRVDGKSVLMHTVISGFKQTDHKDGNGLNNRRSNLRKSTKSQNQWNRGRPVNNTSGFKGVHFKKAAQKWIAGIYRNNKRLHLGYFCTPREAAHAYDEAAKALHGEFARLNFP